MSRKTKMDYAGSARHRARQAAAQLKPVADQVRPLAKSTGTAAKRGLHRTRAWAAPQVERTGKVLQDNVAPKISALLSRAAKRIEPAAPARSRWRKPVGAATITAAGSAVAAFLRSRKKPAGTNGSADDGSAAAATHEEYPSSETHVDGQVKTS